MSFIYSMTDTWNAIGTTFNAIYMNISNGAGGAPVGAAASRAFRLDSNSSRITDVDINGNFVTIGNITGLSNTSTFILGASSDVILVRDAANTLAQRNGTNAQTFNLYKTFTDASNYERASLFADANGFHLLGQKAGTGSVTDLELGTGASGTILFSPGAATSWKMNSSGHFLAQTDNTYDIGASGATRPRIIYPGMVVKFASITLTSLSASIIGAASAGAGAIAYISDGNVPVVFTTVAGGGTTPCPVYSDGAQWRAG